MESTLRVSPLPAPFKHETMHNVGHKNERIMVLLSLVEYLGSEAGIKQIIQVGINTAI